MQRDEIRAHIETAVASGDTNAPAARQQRANEREAMTAACARMDGLHAEAEAIGARIAGSLQDVIDNVAKLEALQSEYADVRHTAHVAADAAGEPLRPDPDVYGSTELAPRLLAFLRSKAWCGSVVRYLSE